MSMYVGNFFVVLGILSAGIIIIEKSNRSGLDKFNKKHDISISQEQYCKFEGLENIKTARDLLLLQCIYLLLEVEDSKTILITLVIYFIVSMIFYNKRRKRFIEDARIKESTRK